MVRIRGDKLPDAEVESLITQLVNLAVPTEPTPFIRRENLRENLRQAFLEC